ncbi:hypothetical protein ANO11243_095890 [Dothideomycetidae sp. 11243]|nr:hypothetical protein ANO11243_095890 [fungal sp. No.11243]
MSSEAIPMRTLGDKGPSVPALGLGLSSLTYDVYGSVPSDEDRLAFLDHAYDLGARFWDTADIYGDGEALLRTWFKQSGKRDQIFLASKFGLLRGSPTHEVDSSAAYCRKTCQATLDALGIDCIDLYYMHSAKYEVPIEETMRAMVELQTEGKIKHIGLCAVSSATLVRACKIARVAAVQVEYSPFVLDIEIATGTDLLATARRLGVAIVAAMPLGRGLLTSTFARGDALGDAKDKRAQYIPRFHEDNRGKNVELVAQWQTLAHKKRCTASQLALAWLLMQGSDIVPIPGTKRVQYLDENWASLNIQLSNEDELEVRAFLRNAQPAGHYMPAQFMHYIFRDTVEEA